ncbi:MAG: histidine phosphatase family protein [Bacteroidota bacterium]
MKTLYLVRHAKSSWADPSLSDFERPLNGRGKRDAPVMGGRLKRRGIMPDLMLSSPAKRAFKTCKVIAKEIGYPKESIVRDRAVYHADEDELLEIMQQQDDKYESIMLFGHNPGFTYFANELAHTEIDNIPTCGVFACELNIEQWSELRFGTAKMLFFDYPKKLVW